MTFRQNGLNGTAYRTLFQTSLLFNTQSLNCNLKPEYMVLQFENGERINDLYDIIGVLIINIDGYFQNSLQMIGLYTGRV